MAIMLLRLIAYILVAFRALTVSASSRAPLLDYNFGEVHFRRFGTNGLRTSLGNPFPASNLTLKNEATQQHVRSIAVVWHAQTPIYVMLDVYVTVFNSKTRRYSTSKISLQLENDQLSYTIERKFLQNFAIDCDDPLNTDVFVHRVKLPSSTKSVIFGLHNWVSFPKNRLVYPPAMLTYYGRSFTSFPLADGVATKCKSTSTPSTSSANELTVEISGEFELSSKVGHQPKIYAHADSVVDVSSYYAQTRTERRCHGNCHPVYFDGLTVAANVQLTTTNNFSEFACRPSAGDDVLEWWRCPAEGRQVNVPKALSLSGVAKYNLTASLGDYLVYCSSQRFRDARALRWRWYNETGRKFDDFPLKGWRGSDTSCLWFTASLETAINRRAYQCIETSTGRPVKEVYFEYNQGETFTESCKFHSNGATYGNYSPNKSTQKPSVVNVTPGQVSRAKISCHIRRRLNIAEGTSDFNSTSTFSVVRSDKTEATTFEPEFILQAHYAEQSNQFHLSITTDVASDIALRKYLGIYTLVLHFENDVSQLVVQFRIRRASLGPGGGGADDADGSDPSINLAAASLNLTLWQLLLTFSCLVIYYSTE